MEEDVISYRETLSKVTGFYIGLDLGQAADFSALVVNERAESRQIIMRKKPWQPEPVDSGSRMMVRHRVRYIHRYPLGTSYPDIVASVARLMAQLPEMRDKPELWIDATGVGRAVLNIFQEARLDPVGVAITAGAMAHRVSHSDIRIPKRELASLMQAALQTERVTIARDLAHSRTLEDELSNFRVKLAAGGNESYEGRSGVHDDLVLALAIAVWAAEKRDSGPGASWLEIARQQMEDFHESNGGRPTPIVKTHQPGSVEYAAQEAAKKAENGDENT
jgi:hypothetical protein